jgi:Zn-dependent protease with chaperone function
MTPYPPGPATVPPGLTTPGWRYRWQVVVVLVSLFTFLFLYLGMIGGAAYLFAYAFTYPVGERDAGPLAWKVMGLLGSGFLLFCLLRGLFRRSKANLDLLVEVREADQPTLFAFLRRLCDELKAPFPHRVFLSPEVTAAVFADTSLVSLFRPARRDLLVGLGLVHGLNLTEFKAVLAHEFGHFSQRSTRLTRYVYTASPVMADLVYRRDWLDVQLARGGRWLLQVVAVDVRLLLLVGFLTFPVLVPLVALWVFRVVLEGLYKAITFQNLSLLRQMEFNADLVAASVTGSDAPVHALARLLFATEALAFAREELAGAADHGVYTRDLFYHQGRAAEHLRRLYHDPRRGDPPPLPEDPTVPGQVFRPEDRAVLAMWSTHPPNHEREQNLKRRYFRGPVDERSPWVLFQDVEAVRARVSERFCRVALEAPADAVPSDPEAVQAVLDGERAEATYDPRYRGTYDDRYLEPLDLEVLTRLAAQEPWGADRLARAHAGLFDDALGAWLAGHRRRLQEFHTLGTLSTWEGFEFRGRAYPAGDARRMRSEVRRELDQDQRRWADLDRNVFSIHYRMGLALDAATAQELVERYRFHLAVQELLTRVAGQHDWVGSVLNFLAGATEMTEDQYREIVRGSLHAHQTLCQALATAHGLALPSLKHVPAGLRLGEFLTRKGSAADFHLDEKALRPKRLGASLVRFVQQLGTLRDRLRRVHFKSLGGILALQEQIHARWTGGASAAGAVGATTPATVPGSAAC